MVNDRCPVPGCQLTINTGFHFRGACLNRDQKDTITSCANKQVHRIRKAVQNGEQARWTLLVNAGSKLAVNATEDVTIPDWMLPEDQYGRFGSRAFADKVDMVLVKGWGLSSTPRLPRRQRLPKKLW